MNSNGWTIKQALPIRRSIYGRRCYMREQLGGLFWLAISVFVCVESIRIDIGTLRVPGPGFLLFWSAVVLGLFAIALIIVTTINKKLTGKLADPWKGLQWGRVIAVLCSLFLYTLLLPKLGYLLATFALMFFVASIIDDRSLRLWRHGISAVLIVVASYLVFDVFLDLRLPKGMFSLR
jgi:putative tricarboxylic transport membrane protein